MIHIVGKPAPDSQHLNEVSTPAVLVRGVTVIASVRKQSRPDSYNVNDPRRTEKFEKFELS